MNKNHEQETFNLPDLADGQAILVVSIAAQLLVVLAMLCRDGLYFSLQTFVALTVYVQAQAMVSAVVLSLLREPFARFPKNFAASLSFFALMLVAFVMAVFAYWYTNPLVIPRFDLEFVGTSLLISAIVVGITLRYLFVQQGLIEKEKTALMANISALQARMRPHFLFNTMNTIASLISFAPDKAEKMIEDLCELLRASLQDEVETTLEKEWYLCERYLDIEKLRLDERLNWESNFDGVDMQVAIPRLSLQPIIENAIYHGIQPCPDAGFLKVSAEYQGDLLAITVINSQSKEHQKGRANKGNKMAIQNTRRRIKQLYGTKSDLQMLDHEDTFEVILRYVPRKGEKP